MRFSPIRRAAIVGSLIILIGIQSRAQEITIDFIEFSGRNIVVHYNLDDGGNSTRQFLVQLYSSQDNFTTPVTKVTGDLGTEVSAGIDKRIVWDITQEFGAAYKGNLSLELRGRVYVPFVKLQQLEEGKVFKRGRNYPLNWTSGNLSGQINIELYNEKNERLWGENNVSNLGKFDWYIPANIKKGSNYRLKFTNVKDRNDVVYSKAFVIKPKVPMIVKLAGAGAVAAAAGFLATQDTSTETKKPLTDPPAAPNN